MVGPDARECAASGDQALEVINVGGLQIRSRRLIVAAVFIEPWNRIGIVLVSCADSLMTGKSSGITKDVRESQPHSFSEQMSTE
jgi:hypothetical protein